jgi:methylenetetrahydrofolate reductase (NADPH)
MPPRPPRPRAPVPRSTHSPLISELLTAQRPTFSVEFFPPNTDVQEQRLWRAVRQLEPLKPTFVSVTYGAGGSTRDRTVRVTGQLATETTLLPMGHLTAVDHSKAELRNVIGGYADVGVRNVLVVRGDPPGDPNGAWIPREDGLTYASELVEMVKSSGDFCVGVAAFPEKHPRSPDVETDTRRFVEKCRAGADFAITNMFFYAEDYLALRDRVAAEVDIPILPGIMPVTNLGIIDKAIELSGCRMPTDLYAELDAHRDDSAAVREIGVQYAIGLCERLLAEGAPGLHFITLNFARATREIYDALGLGSLGSRSGSTAPITA